MKRLPLILALILLAPAVLALTEGTLGNIVQALNVMNVLFALNLVIWALLLAKRSSKMLGRGFVWVTAGICFLASIRLLYLLVQNVRLIPVSDVTLALGWHLLFWTSVSLFILSLITLRTYERRMFQKEIVSPAMVVVLILLAAWMMIVFLAAPTLDPFLTGWLEGNVFMNSMIGFISLVLLGCTGYLLVGLKRSFGRTVTGAIRPGSAALTLFALVQLWELLGETWHVLPMSDLAAEAVEGALFFLALIAIFVAIGSVRRGMLLRR